MKRNILTFIVDSSGNFANYYKPNLKSRATHVNVLQVVAPFSPSVNIAISYVAPHIKRKPFLEFMALTDLEGKDVLDTSKPELNSFAEWSVWELTIGEKANNLLITNRPTKVTVNFNFIDYVITDSFDNTIEFGINKEDIPTNYLENTLYINRVPNFYSTVLKKKLFEGEAFKADSTGTKYIPAQIGTLILNATYTELLTEPAFIGDIPSSVVPEGVDFNTILSSHDDRLDEIEDLVLHKVFGIDDAPDDGLLYGRREEEWSIINEQIALDILNALNIDGSPIKDSTQFPSFDIIDGGEFKYEDN